MENYKLIIKLIFVIIVIFAFANQIESLAIKNKKNCPKLTERGQNNTSETYIVLLTNPKVESSSVNDNNKYDDKFIKEHFKMLKDCFDLNIIKPGSTFIAASLINPKTVVDFSIPRCILGYIANLSENTARYLKNRSEVSVIEKDSKIKIADVQFNPPSWFGTFCAGCPNIDDNSHGTSVASISNALDSAVATLADNGIHVIAAAGNEYKADACAKSPAGSKRVITVGALNTYNNYLADFTNIGSCVTLFAPGVNVPCAGLGSSNVISKSGTSQAAPHVADTE
ncbi:5393_t:CDS:2 [Diversispora eburnea]|uniref:5393_t:CDS:1 n=1 Tax=Diversispora eburnea TaxID=1213867 RepID=A0A9N8VCJ1_9GLOM|nr:5393_t:CDS:2 [Diversispora eburnea]